MTICGLVVLASTSVCSLLSLVNAADLKYLVCGITNSCASVHITRNFYYVRY